MKKSTAKTKPKLSPVVVVDTDIIDFDLDFDLDVSTLELTDADKEEFDLDVSTDLSILEIDDDDYLLLAASEAIDDERLTEETLSFEKDEDLLLVIGSIDADAELKEVYGLQTDEVSEKLPVVVEELEPDVVVEELGATVEDLTAPEPDVVVAVEETTVKAKTAHKSRPTKPSVRIASRLGVKAVELEKLLLSDVKTDEAIQSEFAEIVDSLALYVSDKAVNLMDTLHKGGGLNAVTERGFKVLIRDGKITTGIDGNITKNLLSKPYSPPTAASQGNQLMQLFTALKIATPSSRGVLIENLDSAILEKIKKLL